MGNPSQRQFLFPAGGQSDVGWAISRKDEGAADREAGSQDSVVREVCGKPVPRGTKSANSDSL